MVGKVALDSARESSGMVAGTDHIHQAPRVSERDGEACSGIPAAGSSEQNCRTHEVVFLSFDRFMIAEVVPGVYKKLNCRGYLGSIDYFPVPHPKIRAVLRTNLITANEVSPWFLVVTQ
jgi:hypothetical protein